MHRFASSHSLAMGLLFFCSPLISQAQKQQSPHFHNSSSPGLAILDRSIAAINAPYSSSGITFNYTGTIFQAASLTLNPYLLKASKSVKNPDHLNSWQGLDKANYSISSLSTGSANYLNFGFQHLIYQYYSPKTLKSSTPQKQALANFSVELGAAYASRNSSGEFHDLNTSRWGTWLGLHYRPSTENPSFALSAIVRYIRNEQFEDYSSTYDFFDTGLRVNYDFTHWSLGIEHLQRIDQALSESKEFRTNLVAQIQINPYLNVHGSFGHNYSSRNSLLAQLGLSVHFSRIN